MELRRLCEIDREYRRITKSRGVDAKDHRETMSRLEDSPLWEDYKGWLKAEVIRRIESTRGERG